MEIAYEKMDAMTFIGYHTEIPPGEGYVRCPEFWNKEFGEKYARLWNTMKPENAVEDAILANNIGAFALCADAQNGFTYWIAGLYRGGNVPEGLELYTYPASEWAVFTARGPIPAALQKMNTEVWDVWFPAEGKRLGADGGVSVEHYSNGDPQSDDYVSQIWIPIGAAK